MANNRENVQQLKDEAEVAAMVGMPLDEFQELSKRVADDLGVRLLDYAQGYPFGAILLLIRIALGICSHAKERGDSLTHGRLWMALLGAVQSAAEDDGFAVVEVHPKMRQLIAEALLAKALALDLEAVAKSKGKKPPYWRSRLADELRRIAVEVEPS